MMTDKYFVTFDSAGAIATRLIKGLNAIPADAVAVDSAQWMSITQDQDGTWVLGPEGTIVKIPLVLDLPALERAWRDIELSSVIWLRDRHRDQLDIGIETTLTAEQFTELLTYMQALRDWPQSEQFPVIEHRPVAPPWIAEQAQ